MRGFIGPIGLFDLLFHALSDSRLIGGIAGQQRRGLDFSNQAARAAVDPHHEAVHAHWYIKSRPVGEKHAHLKAVNFSDHFIINRCHSAILLAR